MFSVLSVLSLSSVAQGFQGLRPLIRRQRFHRQRVDFLAHAVAQRLVDQLVLLHLVFATEGFADDYRFPVMAVAGDFNMFAIESVEDGLFDAFWCDHH